MAWQTIKDAASKTVHALPAADILPHQEDVHCFCMPQTEQFPNGWTFVEYFSFEEEEAALVLGLQQSALGLIKPVATVRRELKE